MERVWFAVGFISLPDGCENLRGFIDCQRRAVLGERRHNGKGIGGCKRRQVRDVPDSKEPGNERFVGEIEKPLPQAVRAQRIGDRQSLKSVKQSGPCEEDSSGSSGYGKRDRRRRLE